MEKKIRDRLLEFDSIWKHGTEEDLFSELIFCLLTPQSKALTCWQAVINLIEHDLLLHGGKTQITRYLEGVRFHNNKARYILGARKQFVTKGKIAIKGKINQFKDNQTTRDWLVQTVKGMGYKESSHFLRNIGLGKNIAILDRHILKNLKKYKVIEAIPPSISKVRYYEMEQKLNSFAETIKIPIEHLDLLFWYMETGKVFK